jgi:hypothetical protein
MHEEVKLSGNENKIEKNGGQKKTLL